MQYIIEKFTELVSIHSPTGYTESARLHVTNVLEQLGYLPKTTRKGCILVDLGGEGAPLVFSAHIDTIGAMVSEVKNDGHLRISRIGGLIAGSIDGENCMIFPRFSEKGISGCCQMKNPSSHVNTKLSETLRDFETLEIVLDELVQTKEDVNNLGIFPGDYVCFSPRLAITDSGFIKSRFLDDKIGVAILLALAKSIREGEIRLSRKVYLFISSYEEVGHGARAGIPQDAVDFIAIDMGCVGEGLTGSETQVCICAKDAVGPSDYSLTNELILCAKRNGIDYAVDVYTNYSSDGDAALRSGNDLRHCVMGMGVYASHGYERTHMRGVLNTFELIKAYICKK